jgi:aminoglycoside phosphotransferase (APT) family kinase protein
MTPRVTDALRISGVLPDVGRDTKLSAIKMRNSSTQGGSLVSLLFVDEAPTPRYVLRVPRDPARPERLASNFSALTKLTDLPGLRDTVPIPAFSGKIEGVHVTIETFLDGSSAAMEIAVAERRGAADRQASIFEKAASWLWRLHESTWEPSGGRFLARCKADIDVIAGSGFLTPERERVALSLLEAASAVPVPFAWCHGDYNPNNLLLKQNGESIGVIDWEYAGADCALFDLFQFATISWLFPAWSSGLEDRSRQLWTQGTWIGREFLAATERYARRSSLPSDQLQKLFPLYVYRMAADLTRLVGARQEKMYDFWHALLKASV